MKSFDATRPEFSPYGLTCERWTLVPMTRADRHNEIELNLLLEGSLTYLLGGDRVTIEAGSLAAFWAAIPHQILGQEAPGPAPEYFVATIPLAWFLQLQLPACMVQPILRGRVVRESDAARFRQDVERFGRWAEDLDGPSAELRRASILEIEARLLRLGAAAAEPEPGRDSGPTPSRSSIETELGKAEQMARHIAQNYTSPISVEEISRAVGLHPGYAMTLFRKAFGMTLVTCVNQHRLTHAQRLLTTTNQQILTIAFESGFGSLSRFNDAFRRAVGRTPRQYRSMHQADSARARPGPSLQRG